MSPDGFQIRPMPPDFAPLLTPTDCGLTWHEGCVCGGEESALELHLHASGPISGDARDQFRQRIWRVKEMARLGRFDENQGGCGVPRGGIN